jgi:hypothetical protein
VATIQERLANGTKKMHKGYVHHSNKEKTVSLTESQKTALMWRKMYGLPPIEGKARPDAIKDLEGMMNKYSDDKQSPVDAVREIRENVY